MAGPFDDSSLPRLKRQFSREVKRNLFEAYLRPRRTIINLTSTTTSSAAAFPGGEAFDFIFSQNGHWTLALCSSRIYVLDTVSAKVCVQRELKVLRRPVSAAILDDGSILAVLSSRHQVNIYDLSKLKLKHLRAISLDNPPNIIALSPKGEVLAAAYEGGIEVHSLTREALATDRRAVKCDVVDSLAFSSDGTMLLGTTHNSKNPNTVVLSAPYYSEANQELPVTDLLSHMWTSQILFPNSSRDCSHAALLAHHIEGDSSWTFTYDRVYESFRAVRTDDLRNGTTYFTGPKALKRAGPRSARKRLVPCTLPSTSDRGELVAAGFLGKEVWLYGVPESLDSSAEARRDDPRPRGIVMVGSSVSVAAESNSQNPARSLTSGETAELMRLPHWQVLVDKYRNVFAKGHRVADVPGVAGLRWVSRKHERSDLQSIAQRLIVAAPGGVSGPVGMEQDEFATVDGGRLVILDFDRTTEDGTQVELTFEVGNISPELLEEEDMDMDTEVALVRQRTVRQRKDGPVGVSVVDVLASAPDMPVHHLPVSALRPSNSTAVVESSPIAENSAQRSDHSPPDGLSLEEASAVFDGPYSHTHPRSRSSLYRSATAVAANRQRNPPRILSEARGEYRRADGRGELPHESDADNWVPPPPPYTPDADRPLPEHLNIALMPRRTEPIRRTAPDPDWLRRARTTTWNSSQSSPSRRLSSLPERPFFSRSQTSSAASSQIPEINEVSSGSRPQNAEDISMSNSVGFSRRPPSEISSSFSRSSTTQRPTSNYTGPYSSSLQEQNTNRPSSPITPIPKPLTPRQRNPGHSKSVSLPSSPIDDKFCSQASTLTLSGANLQQRLDYLLPPAPRGFSNSPSPPERGPESPMTARQATYEIELIAANMPSAQQLANLHNRYRRSPSPHQPLGVVNSEGYRPLTTSPAPPRGALGAAGSTSPAAERRRLSISQRNPFAASSPALLRPVARRLDTIQSISSVVMTEDEAGRGRSMDIVEGRENELAMTAVRHRRSRSLGPVIEGGRGEERRTWWGGRRAGRRERGGVEWEGEGGEERARGGKCVLM